MQQWSIDSWRKKTVKQDVVYNDEKELNNVLEKLGHLPPLVSHGEVDKLRSLLEEVALNKRFLLQGGDCAELFKYCSEEPIKNKLKVLLQMSLILVWGARTPIVRIARMAGQYAKPRSSPVENVNGVEYPSFRGDNVNGMPLEERNPDPNRLLGAYFHSAATINYVRSLLGSDFANLHHPENWTLDHVENAQVRREYQDMVDRLLNAFDFMHVIGADQSTPALQTVDIYMSHEGLLLEYESKLTRKVGTGFYNLGTHFLWIGDRTRQLNGGHVEYFRGIKNPIGVKVGPSMKPEELGPLLDIIDPNFETGKVTLITRYGASKIEQYLPEHIKAVKKSGHIVVWCCDPMHGNTETTSTGLKTRKFDYIMEELTKAFEIHKKNESQLGGVHLELTGDPVTEAIGGSMNLSENDLSRNYQTYCDPRLNYEQSMDVAYKIADYFQRE